MNCFANLPAAWCAIREKKVSSAELIQAHIERNEAVNPKLNAIVQLPAAVTRASNSAEGLPIGA